MTTFGDVTWYMPQHPIEDVLTGRAKGIGVHAFVGDNPSDCGFCGFPNDEWTHPIPLHVIVAAVAAYDAAEELARVEYEALIDANPVRREPFLDWADNL